MWFCQDDPSFEPTLAPPPKVHVIGNLEESMALVCLLLYDSGNGDGAVTEQTQNVLEVAAILKRRYLLAAISWTTFLLCVLAADLPDLCL